MNGASRFHLLLCWVIVINVAQSSHELQVAIGDNEHISLVAHPSLESYWSGNSSLSSTEAEADLNSICEESTGCALWPAAQVMITYLSENTDLFQKLNVLELGAGSGAVGIALHRLGAANVLLTDVHAALPLLRPPPLSPPPAGAPSASPRPPVAALA